MENKYRAKAVGKLNPRIDDNNCGDQLSSFVCSFAPACGPSLRYRKHNHWSIPPKLIIIKAAMDALPRSSLEPSSHDCASGGMDTSFPPHAMFLFLSGFP